MDAMHSKYKVNAVGVNHFRLILTQKPSTAATSIGMNSKNKNLLSPNSKNKNLLLQNSKLKFKLTPKLTLYAMGLRAAIRVHGGTTTMDAMHSKYKVNVEVANHSSTTATNSTAATSIGTTV